jgi:hypothetical protein
MKAISKYCKKGGDNNMIHRLHYRYLNSYLTVHFRFSSELLKGNKGGKQEKIRIHDVGKSEEKFVVRATV